ncbi:alpha/beta hydrolase [uncultured Pseudacidovorax sp.]|uniref:alpha/beta hydrolase n=1 Tax=uncultured Pseudacidovorax sp. TaxID=679313 RepID=UPI0025EE7B1E|nr:alpha/beta hydrolase [uncultured Pseudacidovorax sp.]
MMGSATTLAMATVNWTEQSLEVSGPQGPLRGTLTRPGEGLRPEAAVLIVPGSGPTDRDGNNPLGVKAGPYRRLAHALGAQNIATLRIDKRGLFGSAGAVPDPNAVTVADYVHDVRAWASRLREETDRPCVWLLGHSEGGVVALAAAQQPEGLCGVLLLAAPGQPVGQVLRDQLHANPANAPLLPQAMQAIATLEAGRRVDPMLLHPALQPLFAAPVQPFLIDLFRHDPAGLAARVRLPLLIAQGGHDLQVAPDEARRLHEAAPWARVLDLPRANHVLSDVPADDPAANLASYGRDDQPLAKGLLEGIVAFLRTPGAAPNAGPQ